jgi:hypothetical protein
MAQYEVWCSTCSVTFPTGTKRCLHCGGRTQPEPPRASRHRVAAPEPELLAAIPLSYTTEAGNMAATPGLPMRGAAVEPEEPTRRSLLRAGMTVMWMILLAAGYAWRACSQQ